MALNPWQIPAGCLQKCKLGSSVAAAHPFTFAQRWVHIWDERFCHSDCSSLGCLWPLPVPGCNELAWLGLLRKVKPLSKLRKLVNTWSPRCAVLLGLQLVRSLKTFKGPVSGLFPLGLSSYIFGFGSRVLFFPHSDGG
jgi:hypothetical protein